LLVFFPRSRTSFVRQMPDQLAVFPGATRPQRFA
jgi:hypothetical protein